MLLAAAAIVVVRSSAAQPAQTFCTFGLRNKEAGKKGSSLLEESVQNKNEGNTVLLILLTECLLTELFF